MTQETMMTETAATTTEGTAASEPATETTATGADDGGQQQVSEGQETQGQAAEGKKVEGQETKSEGAPEKYEFTAPEGQAFDAPTIEAFSEVAKDLNLPQDKAQKVLDKMAPVIAARQAEQVQAMQKEWADSSRIDKEFGGDKLTENLAVAKKAVDAFGTPELNALLETSGLGNHPEVIRFMVRAGKAISEDTFVSGGQAASHSDPAKRMFPSMN